MWYPSLPYFKLYLFMKFQHCDNIYIRIGIWKKASISLPFWCNWIWNARLTETQISNARTNTISYLVLTPNVTNSIKPSTIIFKLSREIIVWISVRNNWIGELDIRHILDSSLIELLRVLIQLMCVQIQLQSVKLTKCVQKKTPQN